MNRIDETFQTLRAEGRKGLMPFLCAGFPGPGVLPDAIRAVSEAGATTIEIGFPFSDPIADGPVIQRASQRSLAAGTTVTGVLANRKQCSGIPYTPVEIAEETKRAYDAGASVVHIHARQPDGSPTFDPKVFAEIKAEIQKRCPIILNFSTGTILEDVSEQCTYLKESKPERIVVFVLRHGRRQYLSLEPDWGR